MVVKYSQVTLRIQNLYDINMKLIKKNFKYILLYKF